MKTWTATTQRLITLGLLLLAAATVQAAGNTSVERLKDAVVKIHTTSTPADYFTPWRLLNARQSSGSGSVISGNRILTNAHVVADATYIQAQKHGDPHKYLARVAFISHEADLAILEVLEPDFFDGLRPLAIGSLPEPLQDVSVFGYPFGGTTLSITRGVLSRIEHQYYAHAGGYFLAGQIDAAINPGNSGGPVIVDNKIVGVVMQSNTSGRAENLGYFVPPSVIKHVLEDARDGLHDGFPDLGFRTQDLESPAMRQAYGVADRDGGILVAHVFENSSASGKILPNDVIMAIDGFDIADDSSLEFRNNLRTNFKYAIDQYHRDDEVDIHLVRGGKEIKVTLVAGPNRNFSLVREQAFEQTPEYLVYGGVVFVPLNMNLIKRWGADWHRQAPVSFLNARETRSSIEKEELVVALKVLAAEVNLGYHDWKNWILESVNGMPIRNFEDFCQRIVNGSETNTVLRDDGGFQMVLNRQRAEASEQAILTRYRVPKANGCHLSGDKAAEVNP